MSHSNEVELVIETATIKAKTRKLRAVWFAEIDGHCSMVLVATNKPKRNRVSIYHVSNWLVKIAANKPRKQ